MAAQTEAQQHSLIPPPLKRAIAATAHVNESYDQGIFSKKERGVLENIYVAVTTTNEDKRTSVWHECEHDSGTRWKPITFDFNGSRYPRYKGGWEVVVFKDQQNTRRTSVCVDLRDVHSHNITSKGWNLDPKFGVGDVGIGVLQASRAADLSRTPSESSGRAGRTKCSVVDELSYINQVYSQTLAGRTILIYMPGKKSAESLLVEL
ncbi:hypothetical protein PENSPDRAFT_667944 [Peniophora sp. CONT]|nr:hypothetical protein PENSPDRAFT_667944 [Peniophora sp. CONT]